MKHLLLFILCLLSPLVFENDSNKTVYICTGSTAYAYHANKNCSGLSNRKPCKKCCK